MGKNISLVLIAMILFATAFSPAVMARGNKEDVREPLDVIASCDIESIKLVMKSSEMFYTKVSIETSDYEQNSRHLFWPGRVVEFNIPVSNREDAEYSIEIDYLYKKHEIEVKRTVSCKAIIPPDTTEIPEFPTIALPIAAVIGLVFVFQRKKKSN